MAEHQTQTRTEIAAEMRAGVREALLGDEWKPGGGWFKQLKMLMPTRMKHDFKKKFLNGAEAMWWAEANGWLPARAYRCDWCPFWHLTTKNLGTSKTPSEGS